MPHDHAARASSRRRHSHGKKKHRSSGGHKEKRRSSGHKKEKRHSSAKPKRSSNSKRRVKRAHAVAKQADRKLVWYGERAQTSPEFGKVMEKKDLVLNSAGRVVSAAKRRAAKNNPTFVKHMIHKKDKKKHSSKEHRKRSSKKHKKRSSGGSSGAKA